MRRLTLSLAVMAFLLAVLVGCSGKPSTGGTSGDGKRDKAGKSDGTKPKDDKTEEKEAKSGAVGAGEMAELKKTSADNLKKIGLAMHNFATSKSDSMPANAIYTKDGKPLLSWRVAILPYVEQDALYKEFKLDEPWDSPHNKKLLARMPKVYAPMAGKAKLPNSTYYQVFTGPNTLFDRDLGPNLRSDFPDGTSATILVVEAGEPVPWTKPEDIAYDPKKPLPKLGGMFPDGFHAAFADVTVKFVRKDFDEQALRDFINPASGKKKDLAKILPRSGG